jgi:hypothetical protein
VEGDGPYRRVLVALFVLVRTAGTKALQPEQELGAATECMTALEKVLTSESHFVLQERDGVLTTNGTRVALDVEMFAAIATLVGTMRQLGIGELLCTREVTGAGLIALARYAAGRLPAPDGLEPESHLRNIGALGIHAALRSRPVVDPALLRQGESMSGAASQLRSVFLQNRLMAGFDQRRGIPARMAKVVVQAVVDRLLAEPNGIAPLIYLQLQPLLLPPAVQACVLAALLGRALGCPNRLLEEIAAAALLRDIGHVKRRDADNPLVLTPLGTLLDGEESMALTGFHWLLEHCGYDDLWLRCALVARAHHEAHGTTLAEAMAEGNFIAAIVRVADRFDELCRLGGGSTMDAFEVLRLESSAGAHPMELVTALEEILATACV